MRRVLRVTVLVASAAVLETLWLSAPGDFVRAGILGFHYGDREHFVSTISLAIGTLAAAGILAAIASQVTWRPAAGRMPLIVAGLAWTGNLLLLAFFVVPLYRPLGEADFASGVRAEIEDGEPGLASALYTSRAPRTPNRWHCAVLAKNSRRCC